MLSRSLFAAAACAASALLSAAHAQTASLPPTPSVQLAVNPVTNKVYAANRTTNTVTVLDATTGTSASIGVGGGPDFIAVDPTRNRVYVDNARDASMSVVAGDTDTLAGTYAIGSSGPIAINPDPSSARSVAYIVRMTSAASDEVTYFSPGAPTWYTIATDSFQPTALAVNPATHTIFVAHYATGDLRIIDGSFNGNDFPHPPTLGMWSKPFAVAANPVTNKVYVITEDARGPIGIVNPAAMSADFPAVTPGHATGPRAIAVNPVTNRIYAAFAGEVIVIDGGTGALTYVPIANAGSGGIALGIDYATNRIYAATALGTLSVIDGATSTVESTTAIAAGTSSIGVNPVTNTIYLYANGAITALAGAAGTPQSIPLTTTITPFAGDTSGASGTLTLSASSAFAPTALPVRKVYYRLDSTAGAWTEAAASGSNYTASFSGLASGSHTLYAFAVDDQVAPLSTGPQSNPLVGQVASYTFNVSGTRATPSVSIASSANPSTTGQAVTFTASVTGSSGAATGTVTFLDGGTTLCASVALASGSAACATSALAAGTHSVTARYSGDTTYAAATSSAINQVVNAPKTTPTVTLASSANPSTSGQVITLSAAVGGGTPAATGSIAFLDGATAIAGCAAVALSSGAASCTTSALGVGTHAMTAQYAGDANYNSASSSTLSQTVNAAKTSAALALASSANPSVAGNAVTFTVTATGSAGTPTGSVSFLDGGAAIAGCAAVTLSAGNAACTTAALAAGTHSISAQYGGDASYLAGTSSALSQSVSAPPPPPPAAADIGIAQSASAARVTAGATVTFTITVTNAGPANASNVSVSDTLPAGVTLVSSSAGCSASSGGLTCALGALAAGSSTQVTIAVATSSAGTITNQASASASESDPSAANNTSAASVTVDPPATQPASLSNISTRGLVSSGENVLIGGFVIGGSGAKTVVITAAGPSLASAGIRNPLADPKLTVVRSSDGAVIATNDDWANAANASAVRASGFAPANASEPAILMTLPPGAYTAIVSSANAGGGVAVVGVFEVDHPEVPLINISTRGSVLTGDDVMIGGFVIQGASAQTVVITGIGPSLASAGIANPLANPTLTIVRSSDGVVVASNDDWRDGANAAQLQAAGFAPANARESAVMLTLPPGAYTAILSGAAGGTGVGIVAIYRP